MEEASLCRIEMLGGLTVHQEGRSITRFNTQMTGVLLAYLACHPRQPQTREVLIEMLWPDLSPKAGRNSLSVALSSLRRQLEPPGISAGALLITDYHTVQLNPAAFRTDLAELQAALRSAERAGSVAERAAFLADAVALYRGTLLLGYYKDWILYEQERVAEQFFQANDTLIRYLQDSGEFLRALEYARRALLADPTREDAHCNVIRLLGKTGDPAAALRQYREMERILQEDLGIPPSAEAQDLARASAAEAKQTTNVPVPTLSATRPRTPLTGMVTFLLIDSQKSLPFANTGEQAVRDPWTECRERLCEGVESQGGHLLETTGATPFMAMFARPSEALEGAMTAQRLWAEFGQGGALGRLRIALHIGEVEPENRHSQESPLEWATRLLAAARQGQILCSEETARILSRRLDPERRLVDLGLFRLHGRSLPERLFAVAYPGMAPDAISTPEALPAFTGNLPVPLTRFFGREEETGRIEKLLCEDSRRLLTLTGPGGSGKTRLATEAAHRLLGFWHGAVWFVSLADLSHADRIPGAILNSLKQPLTANAEPVEAAVTALSAQPTLLLLDNFEHLLEEGARIVQHLLERIPSLTCLVTSRECLNLTGEVEMVVPPLPVPEKKCTRERLSRYACARLFVDRAQAVRSDFQMTTANTATLAGLCERLEGIPLALELAASRARVMTPAQMLSQLARRFDFLVNQKRSAVARHQTLRTAIDWSYLLLTRELQGFFAQLTLFRGGCTAEAAEAVCDQPRALDFLERLRECSFVTVEENPYGLRFRMLESLREYAAEQLTPEVRASLQRRHLEYYLQWMSKGEHTQGEPDEVRWYDQVQSEYENLRAAFEWCAAEETGQYVELGLQLAYHVNLFWAHRGYLTEARQHLAQLLARHNPERRTAPRAWAMHLAGIMALHQSDFRNAQKRFEEALPLWRELKDPVGLGETLNGLGAALISLGDFPNAFMICEESLEICQQAGARSSIAETLAKLGWVALEQGDYSTAQTRYEEAMEIHQELGQLNKSSDISYCLGMVASAQGDYGQARAYYTECLAIKRQLGDKLGITVTQHLLADVLYIEGDLAAAETLYTESLALSREIGVRVFQAVNLHDLGLLAFARSDYPRARALYAESLPIKRELGDRENLIKTLEACADLAAIDRQWREAARLFGAAAALREQMGAPLQLGVRESHNRRVAAVREALEESAFHTAWTHGSALTLEQALDYALHHL